MKRCSAIGLHLANSSPELYSPKPDPEKILATQTQPEFFGQAGLTCTVPKF